MGSPFHDRELAAVKSRMRWPVFGVSPRSPGLWYRLIRGAQLGQVAGSENAVLKMLRSLL